MERMFYFLQDAVILSIVGYVVWRVWNYLEDRRINFERTKYINDQTRCPKCGRMYCKGFWKLGVCTADMFFCSEPTANMDAKAQYLRTWYEANRETYRDRHRANAERYGGVADNFMISLRNEVLRIDEESYKQLRVKSDAEIQKILD